MSYSQNYSASVHYSGSVSYRYPASEHGGIGTVPYSGNIPVNVTINVNTKPFDGSVNRFNTSVDVLTGSVVAMNAAQCAAISRTATDVSTALINGFFGTINTELTQQLQALDSAIKAVFGLIAEQGKAVTDKKTQMEGDYNRISSRYVRLFEDLDTECYKRIYALDKQSFLLSENVQQRLISESSRNTAALNLLGIEDVSSLETLMFVSSINRRVLEVLRTLHDYITQESVINSLVNSLLCDEEINENIPFSIPVIWTESDTLEGGAAKRERFIPGFIDGQKAQLIGKKTDEFCSGVSPAAWAVPEKPERDALDRDLKTLAESCFAGSAGSNEDETDRRIYQTMLSLWHNSEFVSLKRSI